MNAGMKAVWLMMFFTCPLLSIGQNAPAFRQYYFNPYLFNPAFAGINGYTEVSVLYRQQWLGFNNAPSAAGFTVQYPTQNRASFGMNFISQEAVALRTTSTQATFAYRIPITANQFLFFGISGVVGFNNLKLDADYSNDPTILSAADHTVYADANFGLVYALGGLRLGFALPKLLGQKYFSPQDLVNVRYAQLRNQLYSASYKFQSGNFSFEPYALYRINRDLQNWWEAAAIIYYKEKIWTGVSYHSTQGPGFFLGMEIKEKLRVGYSYEVPLAGSEFVSTSSHELHLQLKLGKKRIFKWAARFEEPVKVVAETTQPQPVEQQVKREEEKQVIQPEVIIAPSEAQKKLDYEAEKKAIRDEAPKPEQRRPPDQFILAPGLYVIAGSFQSLENAIVQQRRLIALGYEAVKYGSNTQNNLFYVYLFSSYDLEESRKIRDQLRIKPATKDAWILKIQ